MFLEEEENKEYDENAWFSGDTSAFIEHIMREDEENEKKFQKEKEEKIKKAYEEFKKSLGIYVCTNCGYVIDETKPQKPDGKFKKIVSRLKKCPYCGAIVNSKLFKKVTKEQLDKLVYETKKKKANRSRMVKISLNKMQNDLEKINQDLTDDLNSGKISPENYATLMINLSYNIYRYYSRDENIKLFFSEIRDYAYTNSKNALSRKYSIEKVEYKLEDLLNEYNKEDDINYLIYSKKIEQNHLKTCKDDERNEIADRIKEIDDKISKINSLDKDINLQKKYVNQVTKINDKVYDNITVNNESDFKKKLRQTNS